MRDVRVFNRSGRQAEALAAVSAAWRATEGQAMDMFVMQNLEVILGRVTDAAKHLKVREVSLVDSGNGDTLPAYVAAYPAIVSRLLRQVDAALGVDITAAMTGRSAAAAVKPANGGGA